MTTYSKAVGSVCIYIILDGDGPRNIGALQALYDGQKWCSFADALNWALENGSITYDPATRLYSADPFFE